MRLLCAALGIIALLVVPSASADYSFGFSTRSHVDHAGGSGAGGSFAGETGAGSLGLGDEAGLASAASLDARSPYRAASSSDGQDGAFDCFNSTSLLADAPRPTATCWLAALTATDNSIPLAEKATDPYTIAGGQDYTSAYPPNGFGGSPEPAPDNGDNRSTGGGGSTGAPSVSTPDERNTSSGQSSDGTNEPFHFHAGSDGRGDDILALGQAQSTGGGDPSHHHFHTGDSSTTPIDTSTSLVTTSSVAPTHHHTRDPIPITIDGVAPTHHHVRDPVITPPADAAGATVGLSVVTDTPLTGPSVNFVPVAQPVPEPGTLVLVGLALVAIAFVSKRKSR